MLKRILFCVLILYLAPFAFAQNDTDGTEIFTPMDNIPSGKVLKDVDIDEAMPHYMSNGTSWVITVSDVTISDVDIVTIQGTNQSGDFKVVSQTTSLTGTDPKEKAKQIAKDINEASDLKGDPVDAVSSNNKILITANSGSDISSIKFSNDTGEKENKLEKIQDPQGPAYVTALYRCYGQISGINTYGTNSELKIGFNGESLTTILTGSDLIEEVLYYFKTFLESYALDCWIGLDQYGGYWLIYNIPAIASNKNLSYSLDFGVTDTLLMQSIYMQDLIDVSSGSTLIFEEFLIYIY